MGIGAGSGKAAIIWSEVPSNWLSCRSITRNLKLAYEGLRWKDARHFSLTRDTTPRGVSLIASQIHEMRAERIVFIDHVPHPQGLLLALSAAYQEKPLPPLFFHVYGDFTLNTRAWRESEKLLRGEAVAFICASERQEKLISRFLAEPEEMTCRCLFPADPKVHCFSPNEGRDSRKMLGIDPDDKVILYAGRLSLQKNIIHLTREIASLREKLGFMPWFLIAGGFDDLGAPFFGLKFTVGHYFQTWTAAVAALPPEARSKIRYLGERDSAVLNGLYNAADLFASLSAHHDEDYGMSPAEALCTGCPVALTDWGGYSSFKEGKEGKDGKADLDACDLVPVSIGKNSLMISASEFAKIAVARLKSPKDEAARARRAAGYGARLSIAAATKALREIHSRPVRAFSGFNWRMEKYSESMSQRVAFPKGPRKNTFYEEIYGSYVRSHSAL